MYGIPVIEKNINDNKDNQTRFVLTSINDFKIENKTRTSLVFSTLQKPGALACALEVFKKHNINLIYIESRPSKKVLGEYNFFVDLDKDINKLDETLNELSAVTQYYRILGSYPIM